MLDKNPVITYNGPMFIKEVKKKNKGYEKEYSYHRLMESYRTPRGPRQRTILDLGKLTIPKDQWKILSDRIEDILTGQKNIFPSTPFIECLARHYAGIIIQKRMKCAVHIEDAREEAPEYETVDIATTSNSTSRTIGAEYIGVSFLKKLGLDRLFRKLGFTDSQVNVAILSIVGRLAFPASERMTRKWAQKISAVDELLGTDFTHLSNNALYRISDQILENKEKIEEYLREKEKGLFGLRNNIILYDLTNTYIEGKAESNRKARRGRSKDKRHDCPLLTLGLVIDEDGFPKTSRILKGNIGEPETLMEMIRSLSEKKERVDDGKKKNTTVVIDAGIASEDNLALLKGSGYDYVCVARNKPVDISEIETDDLLTIRESQQGGNKVEVKLIKKDGEHILYCKSFLKEKKEQAMKHSFQKRFEEGLTNIEASVHKKRGIKKYDKVLERIGRLIEKYSSIARFYSIEVDHKDGIATSVEWKLEKKVEVEHRFSGSYFLRTSRTELTEAEIWRLYITLNNVEDAFRSLKTDLNMRPIHHQKSDRSDAHLFITVLAYHLLNSIRYELCRKGIRIRWHLIREFMRTHTRVTTAFNTPDGGRLYIRQCVEAEPFHREIYDALGLRSCPLKKNQVKL